MKRLYIIITAAVAISLASCLDEHPKDQVDQSSIYGSANDIYVNAVASLYNYIGSNVESEGLQGTCRGVWDYNTFTTDEAMNPIRGGDWYDGGLWQNLYQHTWGDDDTYLYNIWKYLYKVIVLTNQSLAVIGQNSNLLTASQRQSFEAEVRAVRAMFYYYAMDMYGRIPLLTTSDVSIADVSQSQRSIVSRYIVDELQAVAPYLPNEHSNLEGDYYGRITQPVVYFLLAKLSLNAEVYTDDNWTDSSRPNGASIYFTVDGNQLNAWQTCQYYCNKITQAGYTLAANYADNFAVHNENSPENIFTIPMDKNFYAAEYHYIFRSLHYKHGGAYSRASENGTSATLSTVRAFGYGTDNVDSRFYANFYADTVYVDGQKVMLDSGEPLVYRPLEVQMNLTYSKYIQTAGARVAKYEIDRAAYADGKLPSNDIVVFRYADVVLMKAEAKVRNGEDGSAEFNAIRERAGMPLREATLDNLLAERRLELMWEGWRRQDLVRFGRFHTAYDQRTPVDGEQNGYTTVFPIPQKTLDLNDNLTQNPGYGKSK